MRKEDLFEAMGDIDPRFIEESEMVHHKPWLRYVVAAASVAAMLVVSLGAVHLYRNGMFKTNQGTPVAEEPAKNLAKVERFELHSEGGYYETCTYEDLANAIRYSGDILQEPPKSLYPVYSGYGSYDDVLNGTAGKQITEQEFDKLGKEFAQKAGTKISKEKINYNETDYESKEAKHKIASKSFVCENGAKIEVSATGDVYVELKDKVAQPSISEEPDVYKRSIAYYEYYFKKYQAFFNFKKATYGLGAIDPNVETPKKIVPMSFHDASIPGDGNNYYEISITPGYDMFGDAIVFTRVDYGKSMGQYPIISRKEAQKQLLAGKGITFDKLFDTIDESRIAGVTLTYMGDVPQPVYTFYLRLTDEETKKAFEEDEQAPTEQAYIKYYVPAINGKYQK